MKAQLLDAWQINHRMNLLLIQNTTDAGFQKTLSQRGGRTVFEQWIHIHQVRLQWLEVSAKDIRAECLELRKDTTADRSLVISALDSSADCIARLLDRGWDDGGKIKGFRKGVIPFLGYLISHESHHRGNMILTLKQAGEKIPDAIKWGLWEWGK